MSLVIFINVPVIVPQPATSNNQPTTHGHYEFEFAQRGIYFLLSNLISVERDAIYWKRSFQLLQSSRILISESCEYKYARKSIADINPNVTITLRYVVIKVTQIIKETNQLHR